MSVFTSHFFWVVFNYIEVYLFSIMCVKYSISLLYCFIVAVFFYTSTSIFCSADTAKPTSTTNVAPAKAVVSSQIGGVNNAKKRVFDYASANEGFFNESEPQVLSTQSEEVVSMEQKKRIGVPNTHEGATGAEDRSFNRLHKYQLALIGGGGLFFYDNFIVKNISLSSNATYNANGTLAGSGYVGLVSTLHTGARTFLILDIASNLLTGANWHLSGSGVGAVQQTVTEVANPAAFTLSGNITDGKILFGIDGRHFSDNEGRASLIVGVDLLYGDYRNSYTSGVANGVFGSTNVQEHLKMSNFLSLGAVMGFRISHNISYRSTVVFDCLFSGGVLSFNSSTRLVNGLDYMSSTSYDGWFSSQDLGGRVGLRLGLENQIAFGRSVSFVWGLRSNTNVMLYTGADKIVGNLLTPAGSSLSASIVQIVDFYAGVLLKV